MAYSKNITLIRIIFLCCSFSLPVISSGCGTKTAEKSNQVTPKTPETLPDEPSGPMHIKQDIMDKLSGSGMSNLLGHPDAGVAPPTIFSPDPFSKLKPENPNSKSKQ